MHAEIPAYVQHVDHTRNGVSVRGGTNWDLSRSAIATPIEPLADPEPIRPAGGHPYEAKHQMPQMKPLVTVNFAREGTVVGAKDRKELRQAPKGVGLIVAGHADASEKDADKLAEKRAQVVAEQLRKAGRKVESVRSFGAEVPLTTDPLKSSENRRVEVYVPGR